MSKLGFEAEALIRAGRTALRPTSADRARVARALGERLAAAGAPSLAPASAVVKARLWSWPSLSAAVVGLGAGGLFVAGAFEPAQTTSPVVSAAAVTALPIAPAPAADAPRADEQARPPAETRPAALAPSEQESLGRTHKPPADRLAEEVRILSRAQTELHAGRFSSAIALLEEHARKFPRGTLAQERRAARIRALCGLGRLTEADAELARLSPGSLHERSARDACAARRKSAEQ